jgi:hypothetical protein
VRYKEVPPPSGDGGDGDTPVATVRRAQRAIPLVPDPTADCCARVRDRLDLPDRETGREWVTFLRALGLANEVADGYRRERAEPTVEELRTAFLERVYGAREVLDALDDAEPRDTAAVFERVVEAVPAWERNRDRDWTARWETHTRRLLEWAVRFGLAERRDGGYVRAR